MTLLFDLGSSKVAGLVCVRAAHGGLEALAAAEAPCRGIQKGVVADLESVRTALDDVARRLRSQVGELPERAVVNLNGSHLTSLNTQGFVPLFPNTRAITRGTSCTSSTIAVRFRPRRTPSRFKPFRESFVSTEFKVCRSRSASAVVASKW